MKPSITTARPILSPPCPDAAHETFTGADDPAVGAYRAAVDAVVEFGHRQTELEAALVDCANFAVGHAYAGLLAALLGEDERALHSAGAAKRTSGSISRRERQLVDILTLSTKGNRARAAGLACEHVREFPKDSGALTTIVNWFDAQSS